MSFNKQFPVLIALVAMCMAAQPAMAQFVEKKNKSAKKEAPSFASRLWYGGGINLGFQSYYGQSAFGIGVSPMVGYKIYGPFSAGPRLSVFYQSVKFRGVKALNLFDTEAGAFVRAKVFRGLFLQGEVSQLWYQQPYTDGVNFITVRQQRGNQYAGIGYNFGSGQGGGSEISVMYNFAIANDPYVEESPFDIRFGFTWNF